MTAKESASEVFRLRTEGLGSTAQFLRSQDRPLLLVIDQFEEILAGGPTQIRSCWTCFSHLLTRLRRRLAWS